MFRAPIPSPSRPQPPYAASICRRGHVQNDALSDISAGSSGYCGECGAKIIAQCSGCGTRIRGADRGMAGAMNNYIPPRFCDGCGEPLPWATREDCIFQLENILDDAPNIDQATRLLVLADLERLRTEFDLDDKKQTEIWKRIKDRAPGLFTSSALSIIQNILTAAIIRALDLS